MKCTSCGRKNDENDVFCAACGFRTSAYEEIDAESKSGGLWTKPRSYWVLFFSLVAAGIMLALVWALLAWTSHESLRNQINQLNESAPKVDQDLDIALFSECISASEFEIYAAFSDLEKAVTTMSKPMGDIAEAARNRSTQRIDEVLVTLPLYASLFERAYEKLAPLPHCGSLTHDRFIRELTYYTGRIKNDLSKMPSRFSEMEEGGPYDRVILHERNLLKVFDDHSVWLARLQSSD